MKPMEIQEALVDQCKTAILELVNTDGVDAGNVSSTVTKEAESMMPYLQNKFEGQGYTPDESRKMAGIVMALNASAAAVTVLDGKTT